MFPPAPGHMKGVAHPTDSVAESEPHTQLQSLRFVSLLFLAGYSSVSLLTLNMRITVTHPQKIRTNQGS